MTKKVLIKRFTVALVVEKTKDYRPETIKLKVVKRFFDTEKEAEECIMEDGGLYDKYTILPVYSIEEVWEEDPKPVIPTPQEKSLKELWNQWTVEESNRMA